MSAPAGAVMSLNGRDFHNIAEAGISGSGRWRHAGVAIGGPGQVLGRVRLVFTWVQQPPIGVTGQITWPRCQYVPRGRIETPDQTPLALHQDVPRLIDVFHGHGARSYRRQSRRRQCALAGRMRAMPVRYAYLGPAGTFTEAALAEFDPSAPEEAMPCASIPAALDAVRAGTAERAIVPIESSVEGAVTATLDELAAGPDLAIQAELLLPVTFALLGREGTGLADIKTVGGHPQAQPQCRRWLAQHLPDAEWLPTSSNAEAARQAAGGHLDAALAGAFAPAPYGLAVLAAEVNDVPDAVTRFVVVSRPGPVAASTGADRTSLVAFLREDHPGALMELLPEFAVRGINLTRIESRPTGDGLGKYCFSIDCEGHLDDARVGEALMGLRRVCADVRFLGSYPRRDGGRTQVRTGTSDDEFAQAAAWLGRLRYGRVLPADRVVGSLQVRAGRPWRLATLLGGPGNHGARRQGAAHLLKLRPRGHLLSEQGRLDAVEQALQPADELGLGDAELCLARRFVLGERQGQPVEVLGEVQGHGQLQFVHRSRRNLPP